MTMKVDWATHGNEEVQTIATFGETRVVRLRRGITEIRGGSRREQAEAREWASMFCHEAVLERRRWR